MIMLSKAEINFLSGMWIFVLLFCALAVFMVIRSYRKTK